MRETGGGGRQEEMVKESRKDEKRCEIIASFSNLSDTGSRLWSSLPLTVYAPITRATEKNGIATETMFIYLFERRDV